METRDRALFGVSIGSLAALGVAAALVVVRDDIANVSVALVLVLVILMAAVIGGRSAAVITALISAASFDFFHTRPYNSLKMTSSTDIQATVLLVLVGLVIAELALRASKTVHERQEDVEQLRRVRRVGRLAASGESTADLALAISAELIDGLNLRDCRFETPPFVGEFHRLDRDGTLVGSPTVHRLTADGFELPREGVELPVSARDELIGRFVLMPTPGVGVPSERWLMALALADQLAVAASARAA